MGGRWDLISGRGHAACYLTFKGQAENLGGRNAEASDIYILVFVKFSDSLRAENS
jgi:hypothetical protein